MKNAYVRPFCGKNSKRFKVSREKALKIKECFRKQMFGNSK